MKNQLPKTIGALAITALFIAGVSFAAPWTPPAFDTIAPGNVPGTVTISDKNESKVGGITSEKFLVAGILTSADPISQFSTDVGVILAKTLMGSTNGMFTHHLYVPGTAAKFKIGSAIGTTLTQPIIDDATYPKPLTIDLIGRTAPMDRAAAELISGNTVCKDNVTILSNTAAQEYYSSETGENADILAGQVRLTGGNPQAGKILIATNADGDAVWATPRLQNGVITFDTSVSPVTSGQNCTP